MTGVPTAHLVLWGAGDQTQGFVYARQTLYQLSYSPSPSAFL